MLEEGWAGRSTSESIVVRLKVELCFSTTADAESEGEMEETDTCVPIPVRLPLREWTRSFGGRVEGRGSGSLVMVSYMVLAERTDHGAGFLTMWWTVDWWLLEDLLPPPLLPSV